MLWEPLKNYLFIIKEKIVAISLYCSIKGRGYELNIITQLVQVDRLGIYEYVFNI